MEGRDRLGTAVSLLSLILIGALTYYLSSTIRQVESLEDKLEYQPPSLEQMYPGQKVGADKPYATYIPVYSHIYSGGGRPVRLQTTLSIRNTDPDLPLNLHSVSYFNSSGELVREHLESSASLGPMATAEYLVDQEDTSGGSGANFLVRWSSSRHSTVPVMEAVMIATEGKWLSFTSRGVPIPSKSPTEK